MSIYYTIPPLCSDAFVFTPECHQHFSQQDARINSRVLPVTEWLSMPLCQMFHIYLSANCYQNQRVNLKKKFCSIFFRFHLLRIFWVFFIFQSPMNFFESVYLRFYNQNVSGIKWSSALFIAIISGTMYHPPKVVFRTGLYGSFLLQQQLSYYNEKSLF